MLANEKVPPSIGTLLTFAFLALAGLILLGGLAMVWQINLMQQRAQLLDQADQPALAVLLAHSDFQHLQSDLLIHLENRDAALFSRSAAAARGTFAEDVARAQAAVRLLPNSPEREKQLVALGAIRAHFFTQVDSLTELVKSGDWDGARLRAQSRDPITATISDGLVHDIGQLVAAEKNQVLDDIHQAGGRALLTLFFVALASLLVTAALGWGTIRNVAGRLRQLDVAAEALGRGEFQHRVPEQGKDEIARLARVFNDVSERLSALYQALRNSEAQFRSLTEHAFDYILVIDMNGQVSYASPSFARDFSPNEPVLGKKAADLAEGNDRALLTSVISACLQQSAPLRTEIQMASSSGMPRTLAASLANLLDDPAVKGVVVNLQDVTEQYSLQEQLLRSQKLEALGTLAGGVAHDFNNIVTIILGHTSLMQDLFRNDAAQQRHLAVIDGAAHRAADLTRQLLAFSRKQVLQPRVINLNPLLSELDKMLRRIIPENIELKLITAPQLAQVKADPSQIQQVLLNLAVNARDAMSDGGQLVIETSNASLHAADTLSHPSASAGPHVLLTVSDTGCGIPQDALPHVFEPFFTTKETGKGTGLGLSTVYGIVKQSGGHIWVYSEVGRGTTFKIYFPAVSEAPQEAARSLPVAVPAAANGETILLVEDDDALCALIHNSLCSSGYYVLVAPTPAAAIEIASSHQAKIDLFLTDVIMPGMNGPQLARLLQEKRPDLQVLYMSGYTADLIGRHGVLEPGTQFIEKPFLTSALLRRVAEVLRLPPRVLQTRG